MAALIGSAFLTALTAAGTAEPAHPTMAWVKQHLKEKSAGRPAPRMGYETSLGYDALRKTLIRYGGHNQGGGGEQNSELVSQPLLPSCVHWREPGDEGALRGAAAAVADWRRCYTLSPRALRTTIAGFGRVGHAASHAPQPGHFAASTIGRTE